MGLTERVTRLHWPRPGGSGQGLAAFAEGCPPTDDRGHESSHERWERNCRNEPDHQV